MTHQLRFIKKVVTLMKMIISAATHACIASKCVDSFDFGYNRYFMLSLFKFLIK